MSLAETHLQPPGDMDLLAEEWALCLLEEHNLTLDSCVFHPNGDHGRSHRKEIAHVSVRNLRGTDRPAVYLELRRNGIYHGLPEALFHEAGSSRTVKRNAAEDRNAQHAREFFLPFEQETGRSRMVLRAIEHELLSKGVAQVHGQALAELWMLPDFLAVGERTALLQVLPLAHKIQGDLSAIAACFTHVLGHPVRITLLEPSPVIVAEGLSQGLGIQVLGGDCVVGDSFFDGWPGIQVTVEAIPVNKMADPSWNRWLRTLARVLAEHFLPVHLEVAYAFNVLEEDQGLTLGCEERPALLNVNTCI